MRRTFHAALLLLLPAPLLVSGQDASEIPWTSNAPIVTVDKQLYLRSPRPGAAAMATRSYVGPGLEMMEWRGVESTDDVHDDQQARWSSDNGRTWSEFRNLRPSSNVVYAGVTVSEGAGARYYDSAAGRLVELWMRQILRDGRYHNFTYYRLSADFGRTWSEPKPLRYEEGEPFDPKDPLKPGFLLRNQAYYGANLVKLSDGALVTCSGHVNEPTHAHNDQVAWKIGALCFRGRWNADAKDYEWTAGARVPDVDPDYSTRGLMESVCAELSDGRLMVLWRGNESRKKAGCNKWFSLSGDGGKTLGRLQELKYDDGTSYHSPSSCNDLIRHSVTKKLYWIGNISAALPRGNSPRYPLLIAEVDESIPALRKKTLTVIDDRHPGQGKEVQYSNFSVFENRETHALEGRLTAYGETPGNLFTANNYRYVLTLKP